MLVRQPSPSGQTARARDLLVERDPGYLVDGRDVGTARHDLLDRRRRTRPRDAAGLGLGEALWNPGFFGRPGEVGYRDVARGSDRRRLSRP